MFSFLWCYELCVSWFTTWMVTSLARTKEGRARTCQCTLSSVAHYHCPHSHCCFFSFSSTLTLLSKAKNVLLSIKAYLVELYLVFFFVVYLKKNTHTLKNSSQTPFASWIALSKFLIFFELWLFYLHDVSSKMFWRVYFKEHIIQFRQNKKSFLVSYMPLGEKIPRFCSFPLWVPVHGNKRGKKCW